MSKARTLSVTILSGFLGSGKTTLLNRLLRESHGDRFGVLVNDFGSINIDARLVDAIERDAMTLSNGCVCCSMRGGLVTSVGRMLDRANPPERLLVEASGIADPRGVASAFDTATLRYRAQVDAVITLIDAENARNPRLDAQLVEDQIGAADLAILNKVDLVSEARATELETWIRSIVHAASIVRTVNADIPPEIVIGGPGSWVRTPNRFRSELELGRDHAHDIARYATWHHVTDLPLAYGRVRSMLERLPATVFRAKGVLFLADAPNLRSTVHMVGRRISIDIEGPWAGDTRRSEIVCIGDREAITARWLESEVEACATEAVPLLSDMGLRAAKARVSGRAAL